MTLTLIHSEVNSLWQSKKMWEPTRSSASSLKQSNHKHFVELTNSGLDAYCTLYRYQFRAYLLMALNSTTNVVLDMVGLLGTILYHTTSRRIFILMKSGRTTGVGPIRLATSYFQHSEIRSMCTMYYHDSSETER